MDPIERHIRVQAAPQALWEALTQTTQMAQWMGEPEHRVEVEAEWRVGGPIVVRGFHHVPFENRGTVHRWDPPRALTYDTLSSLSRLPDLPEHHTRLAFELTPVGEETELRLTLSGFPDDVIRRHLQLYWGSTLEILRDHVEAAQRISVPRIQRFDVAQLTAIMERIGNGETP